MKALTFFEKICLATEYPEPAPGPGQAVVAPILSGVCRTDLEIIQGYADFRGVLGHEFVGRVVECDDPQWLGQRVVGEINWPCGQCAWCRAGGTQNHCPQRRALGIRGWDGAFADRLVMPIANLHRVPDEVSDRQAVFTEPLAAAYSLLESLHLEGGETVLGVGDGRLGLLLAQVLRTARIKLCWCGRHREKLALLHGWGIPTHLAAELPDELWDIVVEASGSAVGLDLALSRLKPRGTLALKTTTHQSRALDLNDLVVREWKVVGSRCGPFPPALEALRSGLVQVEPLISAVLPLEQGVEALRLAAQPGVLKVLLQH